MTFQHFLSEPYQKLKYKLGFINTQMNFITLEPKLESQKTKQKVNQNEHLKLHSPFHQHINYVHFYRCKMQLFPYQFTLEIYRIMNCRRKDQCFYPKIFNFKCHFRFMHTD